MVKAGKSYRHYIIFTIIYRLYIIVIEFIESNVIPGKHVVKLLQGSRSGFLIVHACNIDKLMTSRQTDDVMTY